LKWVGPYPATERLQVYRQYTQTVQYY